MVVGVLITAPREEAPEYAEKLVEEGLAACVNTFDVNSIYRWKGDVEQTDETMMLAKTSRRTQERLVERVQELHSYELPEILVLDLDGEPRYLEWVRRETRQPEEA